MGEKETRALWLERIDFHTARQCVEKWHYSGGCTTVICSYGVWESGVFQGAVMFSQGAASCIARPFGLRPQQVRELVRVALNAPKTPVSKIVAVALRLFHRDYPDVLVVVSFADSSQGHVGTIYQAANFLYVGAKSYHVYRVNGELVHPKSLYGRYGKGGQSVAWLRANVDPAAERLKTLPKHKYLWFYDEKLRAEWATHALPYPRVAGVAGCISANHAEGGGSIPTATLSTEGGRGWGLGKG